MFGEGDSARWVGSATFWIALSTVAAAVFVAIQAWYARVQVVEASSTRLLEKELDICFESFDAAAALDTELKALARQGMHKETWPPSVMAASAGELLKFQRTVPQLLVGLETGLMKADVLGGLDKNRSYLLQHISGLGEQLSSLNPSLANQAEPDPEVKGVFASLSEFIGAQYLVYEGCKTVAQRTS